MESFSTRPDGTDTAYLPFVKTLVLEYWYDRVIQRVVRSLSDFRVICWLCTPEPMEGKVRYGSRTI